MPEALAGRLARLIDHYVDAEEARTHEADAPARARERAQAKLARQALAAGGALCAVLRRTAGDAQDRLAGDDPDLGGLLIAHQL